MIGDKMLQTRSRSLVRLVAVVPVLLLAGLLTGCHPAGPGGTVSVSTIEGLNFMDYTQTASGTNSDMDLRLDAAGVYLYWNDGKGLSAGNGCEQLDPHRVRCNRQFIDFVRVFLGDGNDIATNTGVQGLNTYGGPGMDTLNGGDSSDFMHGGPDADTLYGNGGGDTLWGDEGVDFADGGAGNDHCEEVENAINCELVI